MLASQRAALLRSRPRRPLDQVLLRASEDDVFRLDSREITPVCLAIMSFCFQRLRVAQLLMEVQLIAVELTCGQLELLPRGQRRRLACRLGLNQVLLTCRGAVSSERGSWLRLRFRASIVSCLPEKQVVLG